MKHHPGGSHPIYAAPALQSKLGKGDTNGPPQASDCSAGGLNQCSRGPHRRSTRKWSRDHGPADPWRIRSNLTIANDRSFTLLGGVNVLEDLDFALRCASHYKDVCERLNIPLVFKASYDKANRSSIHSFRGPGLTQGLEILQAVKDTHGIPVNHGCAQP